MFVTSPASHLAPLLSRLSILAGRLAKHPAGRTITLESYLSTEYIRLEGVVRVQRSPLTIHQINSALCEGLFGDASKGERAWNEPGRLGCGGLGGPIRLRGARRAVIIED